jgi:Putative DNA-binding domain
MNEAERQQRLLAALWREPESLRGLMRGDTGPGLAAYRANAGAVAERALAVAFPTLAALVGEDSFAALARDFWHRHPPERGDLGEWGEALPAFVAASAQLADEPYLADSARLDWRVHRASRAADDDGAALALQPLIDSDPARLRLALRAACALCPSAWPIVTIHQAHQHDAPDRFAPVQAAFEAGVRETAWIWRDGFAVRVEAVDEPTAAFTQALLDGRALTDALDLSGPGFEFDRWLARALPARWITAITLGDSP